MRERLAQEPAEAASLPESSRHAFLSVAPLAVREESPALEPAAWEPVAQREGASPEPSAERRDSVASERRENTSVFPRKEARVFSETSSSKKRNTHVSGKGWSLAGTFGSGGYADSPSMGFAGGPSSPPMSDPVPGGGTPTPGEPAERPFLAEGDRSFESYPDVSYSLPLSFGLTVRKELGRRMALETGLVYTYLSTTFRRSGATASEVKSGLHYLGVPLSAVVYLWQGERWNLYLSGGVTMEKGLQATYEGYRRSEGFEERKSRKEGIDGLQWSVNASLGASYRLHKNWSLYFEPRFSRYFDGGQPASVRTDKPLGFGLNAGVRYAF